MIRHSNKNKCFIVETSCFEQVEQEVSVRGSHRYRKAKIDCLSLFMCPLLAQLKIGFFSSFSAAAVYSTNKQTKQALSSL